MPMPTSEEAERYLQEKGIVVQRFAEATPTAEAAARAVGCSVAEIAKTILLLVGGQPVAVVTAGDRRVNSSRLKQATALTGKVRFPEPGEVQRLTGYAPGGVSPFLLPPELPLLVDASLRRFAVVYPAAGDDHSAAAVTVEQLLELSGGREVSVCE